MPCFYSKPILKHVKNLINYKKCTTNVNYLHTLTKISKSPFQKVNKIPFLNKSIEKIIHNPIQILRRILNTSPLEN